MSSLYEMECEIDSAKAKLAAADQTANRMAAIIRGRLRHCNYGVLCDLKKELKDFNMSTGNWKNERT